MTRVCVTCATYRNPDQDTFIRNYGIISLINQMANQDYDGSIGISLVDDSPEPHIFAQRVAEVRPDLVSYVHTPTRAALRAVLDEQAPDMAKLVPTDQDLRNASLLLVERLHHQGALVSEADLKLARGQFDLDKSEWDSLIGWQEEVAVSDKRVDQFLAAYLGDEIRNDHVAHFWKKRLLQMRGYSPMVPFEEDFPIQTNTYAQIFGTRPTIGMKKNAGNALGAAWFGRPETIVYADDDDQHAPDYVSRSVAALDGHDFTRMTRYLTYIFHEAAQNAQPGIFELPVEKQFNGYWTLPKTAREQPMYVWMPDEEAFREKAIGDKFSRPVTMAWPVLSHEGALHTYSYDIWADTLDTIGGAPPISFCEDIIFYRMLKDELGSRFQDVLTPIKPGEESFIRIADGNNASLIEVSEHLSHKDLPAWASEAIAFLHAAHAQGSPVSHATQKKLARSFLDNGGLHAADLDNSRQISRPNMHGPGHPGRGPAGVGN